MQEREKIELTDTTMDMAIKMGEGNPGGITVLVNLLKTKDGVLDILHLDDMNIRGSQIWVGYKYFCGEDLNAFVKAIRERNRDMIDAINQQMGPTFPHRARRDRFEK
jgi:tryptophanyl-tRNA synthetase